MLRRPVVLLLILGPLLAIVISLFIGRFQASPTVILNMLVSKVFPTGATFPPMLETAIFQVRLPRILLAVMVGMSLSISGASYQGIFRNPLVSSHVLGVASGAAFGAALGILLSAPPLVTEALAFCFGLIAVASALIVTRFYRSSQVLTMVLVGFILGAFFSSLVSLITYTADPNVKLPAIVFWLMGSLASTSTKDLALAAVPMLGGIIVLLLLRWRINILSLGEEEAKALGMESDKLRAVIILCCTLVTSAAVCVSGVIGWIGLVIPHFGRMIVGPNHKVLLPACLSIGAVYLLFIDDIARTVTSSEIPLGILTGIIGAPIFAYLITKGTRW